LGGVDVWVEIITMCVIDFLINRCPKL
jgi:hypothetical protein